MSVASEVLKRLGEKEFESLVGRFDPETLETFFSDSVRVGVNSDVLYTYNVYVLVNTEVDEGGITVFTPKDAGDPRDLRDAAENRMWGALYMVGRRELGAQDMEVGTVLTLSGVDEKTVETVGVKINKNTWELSGLWEEYEDSEVDEMAGELDGKFYLDGKEIKR